MQQCCSAQPQCDETMWKIYRYFVVIKPGRLVLWCYLLWYFVTLYYHFDPSPMLWINSLGISLVIGTALMLSVASASVSTNTSPKHKADHWQTFRLYWMPFAVSSFAALIKNEGYFVIFSSSLHELLSAVGACGLFLGIVAVIKLNKQKQRFKGKK